MHLEAKTATQGKLSVISPIKLIWGQLLDGKAFYSTRGLPLLLAHSTCPFVAPAREMELDKGGMAKRTICRLDGG
jgi:hypothetical protein